MVIDCVASWVACMNSRVFQVSDWESLQLGMCGSSYGLDIVGDT